MNINDKVLRSAYASKLAYANPANLRTLAHINRYLHGSETKRMQFQMIDSRKERNPQVASAQAYLWNSGEKAYVVAFKGSSSMRDIASFLDVKAMPFHFKNDKPRVHSGVLKMFADIEAPLTNIIGKAKYVTFCGHSLGGALAIFAAAYYAHITEGNIIISCHTFGASRVGDATFKQWYTKGVQEHVNMTTVYDIVPMLPFNMEPISDICIMPEPRTINPFTNHDLDTYIEVLKRFHEIQKVPKK